MLRRSQANHLLLNIQCKKCFVLSPEICDILNKLLKSDEDNATGDVQLLCKLFSGEKSSYHYSTTDIRVIDANMPFSILGSTQLTNAAKLIAKMDQGHGLVDRLLIGSLLTLQPTLSEMEKANTDLSLELVQDFIELYRRIDDIDEDTKFSFDTNAKVMLRKIMDTFVSEVNDAIREGKVPPKSKKPELIPRVSTALHVFNHYMEDLLEGSTATNPANTIPHTTLEKATALVNHLECPKDILCQFLKELTNKACEKTIEQPTQDYIKENVLLAPGSVITYRSFKHSKRSLRSIAQPEYEKATEALQADGFGCMVEFRTPCSRQTTKVFVKCTPSPWLAESALTETQFQGVISKPLSTDITEPMRQHLRQNGFIQ